MKNLFYCLVLIVVVHIPILLVGCVSRTDPTVVQQNVSTLSGEGEYVGTLSDGREVRRYEVEMGSGYNHFIYVVDNGGSVTVNRTESHQRGKTHTTVNRTEVIIDGKAFVPKDEE